MLGLGWVYEAGRGVNADEEQAIVWYTKAADNGSERAQETLERIRKKNRPLTQVLGDWLAGTG